MGFWGWFYLLAVIGTVMHSLLPIIPLRMRHHSFGAEIIAASYIASFFAREITGDATPLEVYASIDVLTALAFLFVALNNQAVWAAICVVLHALMGFLHLAHFITQQANEVAYLWILNTLFLLAIVTVNTAIIVGRRAWGAKVDQFFVPLLGGWNFSGVGKYRLPDNKGEGD